jgi:hypothetical protein
MITFVDQIGRTVIGKLVSETEATLTVDNPVIIHVQPNPQTGQLQVQSFPYLFMEFIDKDSRGDNNWTFHKSAIATSSVKLDDRIIMQYENINTPAPQQPQGEPEVIKLFED